MKAVVGPIKEVYLTHQQGIIMEMEREQQLLTKIRLLEEIIKETESITKQQVALEQKKAFAASLKNFGKLSKTQLHKHSYQL